MFTPSSDDGCRNSWSFSTNWTVAAGSLSSSITVESSDSPIGAEAVVSEEESIPLSLKLPSPDCGPCEIKIGFPQKQEVRQVYIRSTARVFEIYFAPSLQSSNEYLCTVRCGIAARDDEVLRATDVKEPADAHPKGSAEKREKERCTNGEDDWVEVKVLDLPLQDDQPDLVSEKISANQQTSVQDLYEATAEITDPDTCISLTLRLLSLQSKDCINIDEIYVFSDPVESADSETQGAQVGNLDGSSLMSMLVPTLLQLSKTGTYRRQDKHAFGASGKGEYLDVGSTVNESTNFANEIRQVESRAALQEVNESTNFANEIRQVESRAALQEVNELTNFANEIRQVEGRAALQEVNESTNFANEIRQVESRAALQEVNEAMTKPPDSQIPAQASYIEHRSNLIAKDDVPTNYIEKILEQLVSRVSRVEDICLRFEENMVKPISNMEARLQLVEEQVQVLVKNSQHSGLPCCTRISAPEFSCSDSNASSFYNERNENPICGEKELENKDVFNDKFHPGLVVTAPEFSCGDDEENNEGDHEESNGAIGSADGSQLEKPKQALSIDDALAAALAGFITTTNVQPSLCTQTLTVKAPEFTVEENGDGCTVASPSAQNDKLLVPPISFSESNGTDCENDMVPSSTSIDCLTSEIELESTQQDDCQIADSSCAGKSSNEFSISVSQKIDFDREFWGHLTEDFSGVQREGNGASCEDVEKESKECVLGNFIDSSSPFCVVDFELPILDVRFTSSQIPSTLEALLDNKPEFFVEASLVEKRDGGERSNLIDVENEEPNSFMIDNHLLVHWDSPDGNNVRGSPSSLEGEAPKDSITCNKQETFASLL